MRTPPPIRYLNSRLPSNFGLDTIVLPDDEALPIFQYNGSSTYFCAKDVRIGSKFYQVFALNCLYHDYFPGRREFGYISTIQHDRTLRPINGSRGRFDPVHAPQLYNQNYPYWCLIRRDLPSYASDDERAKHPELSPFEVEWIQDPQQNSIGFLRHSYVQNLWKRFHTISSLASTLGRMEWFGQSIPCPLSSGHNLTALEHHSSGVAEEVENLVIYIRREIKIAAAWTELAMTVLKKPTTSHRAAKRPRTVNPTDDYLGLWINTRYTSDVRGIEYLGSEFAVPLRGVGLYIENTHYKPDDTRTIRNDKDMRAAVYYTNFLQDTALERNNDNFDAGRTFLRTANTDHLNPVQGFCILESSNPRTLLLTDYGIKPEKESRAIKRAPIPWLRPIPPPEKPTTAINAHGSTEDNSTLPWIGLTYDNKVAEGSGHQEQLQDGSWWWCPPPIYSTGRLLKDRQWKVFLLYEPSSDKKGSWEMREQEENWEEISQSDDYSRDYGTFYYDRKNTRVLGFRHGLLPLWPKELRTEEEYGYPVLDVPYVNKEDELVHSSQWMYSSPMAPKGFANKVAARPQITQTLLHSQGTQNSSTHSAEIRAAVAPKEELVTANNADTAPQAALAPKTVSTEKPEIVTSVTSTITSPVEEIVASSEVPPSEQAAEAPNTPPTLETGADLATSIMEQGWGAAANFEDPMDQEDGMYEATSPMLLNDDEMIPSPRISLPPKELPDTRTFDDCMDEQYYSDFERGGRFNRLQERREYKRREDKHSDKTSYSRKTRGYDSYRPKSYSHERSNSPIHFHPYNSRRRTDDRYYDSSLSGDYLSDTESFRRGRSSGSSWHNSEFEYPSYPSSGNGSHNSSRQPSSSRYQPTVASTSLSLQSQSGGDAWPEIPRNGVPQTRMLCRGNAVASKANAEALLHSCVIQAHPRVNKYQLEEVCRGDCFGYILNLDTVYDALAVHLVTEEKKIFTSFIDEPTYKSFAPVPVASYDRSPQAPEPTNKKAESTERTHQVSTDEASVPASSIAPLLQRININSSQQSHENGSEEKTDLLSRLRQAEGDSTPTLAERLGLQNDTSQHQQRPLSDRLSAQGTGQGGDQSTGTDQPQGQKYRGGRGGLEKRAEYMKKRREKEKEKKKKKRDAHSTPY